MPLNKRVLSANRANSLNASNGGGSTGPTVIIQNGGSATNGSMNSHLAQQFSMQQRRRHQNTFSNKVVHNNNFTGNASSYGANGNIVRAGQQYPNNAGGQANQVQSSS